MDEFAIHVVVLGIFVIGLVSLIGVIILSVQEKPIPDTLVSITSACIGGLTTLLIGASRLTNGNGRNGRS